MPSQPPSRVVALEGTSNFRDLGGYPGHRGRTVRWRRLFRSAHLSGLTPQDRATFAQLGVSKALDFRGMQERAEQPYELPGVRQLSLAIEPSVVQRMNEVRASGMPLDGPTAVRLMQELYLRLVTDQAHRFAEFFEQLLDEQDAPVVFHCTAGKDRTGVAAALLLLALGVSREWVMRDFLLTNEVFKPPQPVQSTLPQEVREVLWGVRPEFLHTALHAVDAQPGGVPQFLRHRMGLGETAHEALRERFLAPA
jgi:protein-tyrosine phosphatase